VRLGRCRVGCGLVSLALFASMMPPSLRAAETQPNPALHVSQPVTNLSDVPNSEPAPMDQRPTDESRNAWRFLTLGVRIRARTLGGLQFWGDVLFFHGWHIQQNVFTGHYRLLDKDDIRYASGTFEECRAKLEEIRQEQQLPPMSGTAVILLHGIGRSDKSMAHMQKHLEKEGFYVVNFNYPSTRVNLSDAANYLHRVIQSLEGIDTIYLVPFSMGGLVVRTYLAEHGDPRIQRMVMIGVPNQGADLATALRKNWAFRLVMGPAGQQLITGPDGAGANLPIPEFEFAVIAGHRDHPKGYNPLIPGDDDGTVSVECTRLPGAADFATVRGVHLLLTRTKATLEYTAHFLKHGHLRRGGTKQPIPLSSAGSGGAPSPAETCVDPAGTSPVKND